MQYTPTNGRSDDTQKMNDNTVTNGETAGSSRQWFLQASAVAGTGALTGCLGAASGTGTTLTMGYQPFSAHAWEALIMKHSDIPQKYLPDGYSLEWQSALQGAVVGNRISVGKNQVGWTGDMPALMTIAQNETPSSRRSCCRAPGSATSSGTPSSPARIRTSSSR